MAIRLRSNGLTTTRARHRGPGALHRVMRRGAHSLIVTAAAAMIVMVMVTSDPGVSTRA